MTVVVLLQLLAGSAVFAGQAIPDGAYRGTIYGDEGPQPFRLEVRGATVTGEWTLEEDGKTAGSLKLRGTCDQQTGEVSGDASLRLNVWRLEGEPDVGGSFEGAIKNGRLVGIIDLEASAYTAPSGCRSESDAATLKFSADLGQRVPVATGAPDTETEPEEAAGSEAEAEPQPGERIAIHATISIDPPQPKPGDKVAVWGTVTGSDGKPLEGANLIWDVGSYAGNADPRFVWDGKALTINLKVIYQGNEYAFSRGLDAYADPALPGGSPQAPTPSGQPQTAAPTDSPGPVSGLDGAGQVPGPRTLGEAIIGTVVPGLIGIIGGLLSGTKSTGTRLAPPPPAPPPAPVPPPPPTPGPPPEGGRPVQKPPEPPGGQPAPLGEAEALRKRLSHLAEVAQTTKNPALQEWVKAAGRDAFRPDGTVDPERLGTLKQGLREALKITPGSEGPGTFDVIAGTLTGSATTVVDGVRSLPGGDYIVAGGQTLVDFGGALAGGVESLLGGVASIPGAIIDGFKTLGNAIHDLKYIKRGLDDITRDWINRHAVEECQGFRQAMTDGRYLDALGNLLQGTSRAAGAALSNAAGPAWEKIKEHLLPIEEVKSWLDPQASAEERAWAVPSGAVKVAGIALIYEGIRNLFVEPAPGLPSSSPLVSGAQRVEGAGNKLIDRLRPTPPLAPQPVRLRGVLSETQDGISAALGAGDEAERVRRIRELYKGGGMKELNRVQEAGGLSAQQANELNRVITQTVDDAVDHSVRRTISDFDRGGVGVRIREAIVVDSGSSATGGARSILTDADRTYVFTFEESDLARYATERGISRAEAHQRLTQLARNSVDHGVRTRLADAGLTTHDVQYGGYRDFGVTRGGRPDVYPQGPAEQAAITQGRATSYRPKPNGQVSTHQVSGQGAVDQSQYNQHRAGGGALRDSRNTIGSARRVAAQQVAAISKSDLAIDKAAKAIYRMNQQTARLGQPMDPKLLDLANQIRRNPQGSHQILKTAGLTPDAFRNWTRAAIRGAAGWLD